MFENLTKNQKISLWINLAIVAMECYVLPNCYYGFIGGNGPHALMFRFFTEDSNILLGLSSLLYIVVLLVYARKNKELPLWIKRVRFVATTAVTTTFLVVLLFLEPYVFFTYHQVLSMFSFPNMFFTHLICPLSSIISFIFFEEKECDEKHKKYQEAFFTLISVVTYAAIVGSLASNHLISSNQSINNVYGFMDATAGPAYLTPLAFTLIISGTYGTGVLWLFFQTKVANHQKSKLSKTN
jgi:hypothetical protein